MVAGVALVSSAFLLTILLAQRPRRWGARPAIYRWTMAGLGTFYGGLAIIALVLLGLADALAVLLGGLIPATAVSLLFATVGHRTVASERALEDRSADDEDEQLPGVGMDDDTPLGDTSELSDAQEDPMVGAGDGCGTCAGSARSFGASPLARSAWAMAASLGGILALNPWPTGPWTSLHGDEDRAEHLGRRTLLARHRVVIADAGQPAVRSRLCRRIGVIPPRTRKATTTGRSRAMKTLEDVQTWRGKKMVDIDGHKIGTIEDILLDRQTGEPAWVAVKNGLFGLKHTLVPIGEAESVGDDEVRVHLEKEKVKEAPRIDPGGELSAEEERRLWEHYGRSDYDDWQGEDRTRALGLPDEEEDRARESTARTDSGDDAARIVNVRLRRVVVMAAPVGGTGTQRTQDRE